MSGIGVHCLFELASTLYAVRDRFSVEVDHLLNCQSKLASSQYNQSLTKHNGSLKSSETTNDAVKRRTTTSPQDKSS